MPDDNHTDTPNIDYTKHELDTSIDCFNLTIKVLQDANDELEKIRVNIRNLPKLLHAVRMLISVYDNAQNDSIQDAIERIKRTQY